MKLRNPLDALKRPANAAPIPYVSRTGSRGGLFGGLAAAAAATPETLMAAYGSNGTLFPIVDALSRGVGSARWHLYRKAKSGLKEDRVEVTSHLALDIWNRPNKFFTQNLFVRTYQQHQELVGEAVWVVARDPRVRSIPLELWPVRPDRIAPVVSREDFIAGFIYVGPDGEKVPLALDEVIWIRMPNPLDPYRGLGPVQSILTEIDSAKYSAEWNRNFFRNSAAPGGVIQMDIKLEDDEFAEFQERWRESHQGVGNAHRVAILEQGAKWVDRSYSMRDMQFVELADASDETIRKAFRFPKPMLGSVDDVNRANAEAGELVFARWLVKPRLEDTRDVLNSQYLPLFGQSAQGLEFDFEDPTPEDRAAEDASLVAKAGAAATLAAAGYDGNQVLDVVGLPQMDYRPQPKAGLPGPGVVPQTPEAVLARARARFARTPRRRPQNASDEDQEDAQAEMDRLLDELLSDWADISEAQREAIRDQLVTIIESGDIEALASMTVPTEDAAALLAAAMMAQAYAAQQRMADLAAEAGEDVEPVDPAEEDGPLAEALIAAALLAALLLAAGLLLVAARVAYRLWTPAGDDPGKGVLSRDDAEKIADEVEEHLANLRAAELRRHLAAALWQAEGDARWEILSRMDWDWLEAVEEKDDRRCAPCAAIDGTRFATVEDAKKAYPTGGYWKCRGEDRCRGSVEPRWEARSARQASGT